MSRHQLFSAIIFHSVLTVKSKKKIFSFRHKNCISSFFPMLKDHFSLFITCKLFVAGQFMGCELCKTFKEVCVFLGIKGEEILDLGVIVISTDMI